jgi:hypothetical protein
MTNSFIPLGLESGNLTVLTDSEAVGFDGETVAGGFRATALKAVLRHPVNGSAIANLALRARYFVVAAGALASTTFLRRTPALARAADQNQAPASRDDLRIVRHAGLHRKRPRGV